MRMDTLLPLKSRRLRYGILFLNYKPLMRGT